MLKEKIINEIIRLMSDCMDKNQTSRLLDALSVTLQDVEFVSNKNALSTDMVDNKKIINSFILSNKGISTATIQALMGHESYSTTARYYCNQDTDNAKKAVLACA